jgi:hypothetical protein
MSSSVPAGINIAQTIANNVQDDVSSRGGVEKMKELGNSLAQLAAIIMILITLAISTAAVSQWASADTRAADNAAASSKPQTLIATDAR